MNTTEAVTTLGARLYEHGFGEEDLARDMVEWKNLTELDEADLNALFDLAQHGNFVSWDCPTCEARVYEGSPDSWTQFQGVQQNDWSSYPGNGPDDARCDHCRCYGAGVDITERKDVRP